MHIVVGGVGEGEVGEGGVEGGGGVGVVVGQAHCCWTVPCCRSATLLASSPKIVISVRSRRIILLHYIFATPVPHIAFR